MGGGWKKKITKLGFGEIFLQGHAYLEMLLSHPT
jgi:hypothetical protein